MRMHKAQKIQTAFIKTVNNTYNKYGEKASLRLKKCLLLLQVQIKLHPNWFEELDKCRWSIKVNSSPNGIPQIITSKGRKRSHLYHVKANSDRRLEWVRD